MQKRLRREVIDAEMMRRGMSQQDVADAAGISRVAFNYVLNGHFWPRPSTLQGIADALGLTVADIVEVEIERDEDFDLALATA